jgi:hypothetical protein
MSEQRRQQIDEQRRQVRARKITAPEVLPAPVKGWNTRDPYEAMDPQDAITLDNWQPDYGGVRLREGCKVYATLGWANIMSAPAAPVTTLAFWRLGTQQQLLGAQADKIWSVDTQTALASGFQSSWWQTAQFNKHLFWVNGVDPPQDYDGTTLAAAGYVQDPTSTYTLNVNDLIGLAVVHNRLYFWTLQDCGFWYSELQAISGNLNYFPFEMTLGDGAHVVNVQILTYDGGNGIQSYTVFVMSTGEILTYQGTDPSDPANWSLVGIYTAPAPLDMRASCRYGGDTYIVTSSDHTKLSQLMIALKLGAVPPRSKAAGACQAAVAQGRGLTGWQAIYWGFGRRLIINVPLISNDPVTGYRQFEQHIYHTGLDAWCRYQGLSAYCWVVMGDRLLFGGDNGMVVEFGTAGGDELVKLTPPWNTQLWNVTPWQVLQYNQISAFAQQAWNLFGTPTQKRVAAFRPIMRSAQTVQYTFGLGFDYNDPVLNMAAAHVGVATPWNTTPWGSPWERLAETDTIWYIAEGDGSAISVALATTTDTPKPLIWIRTDLRIEPGDAL